MRDYPISAVPGPTAPSSYALHGISDGSVVVPIGVDAHLDGVGGGVPWPLAVPCVPALGFGRERYHRLGVKIGRASCRERVEDEAVPATAEQTRPRDGE